MPRKIGTSIITRSELKFDQAVCSIIGALCFPQCISVHLHFVEYLADWNVEHLEATGLEIINESPRRWKLPTRHVNLGAR